MRIAVACNQQSMSRLNRCKLILNLAKEISIWNSLSLFPQYRHPILRLCVCLLMMVGVRDGFALINPTHSDVPQPPTPPHAPSATATRKSADGFSAPFDEATTSKQKTKSPAKDIDVLEYVRRLSTDMSPILNDDEPVFDFSQVNERIIEC